MFQTTNQTCSVSIPNCCSSPTWLSTNSLRRSQKFWGFRHAQVQLWGHVAGFCLLRMISLQLTAAVAMTCISSDWLILLPDWSIRCRMIPSKWLGIAWYNPASNHKGTGILDDSGHGWSGSLFSICSSHCSVEITQNLWKWNVSNHYPPARGSLWQSKIHLGTIPIPIGTSRSTSPLKEGVCAFFSASAFREQLLACGTNLKKWLLIWILHDYDIKTTHAIYNSL